MVICMLNDLTDSGNGYMDKQAFVPTFLSSTQGYDALQVA